jgi:predicted DsbA family dithiol-disulfide isomerase
LKKEFDIKDEWVSLEIHPDTPKEGVSLNERFGSEGLRRMAWTLNVSGAPYGIEFGGMKLLSNSRMALEASEFAKDNGRFDDFHEKIFHAYFTEGKDIGELDTILDIAAGAGLDSKGLKAALEEGRYSNRLNEASLDAHEHDIDSTPTFVINDEHIITGARPIEIFRRTLKNIK